MSIIGKDKNKVPRGVSKGTTKYIMRRELEQSGIDTGFFKPVRDFFSKGTEKPEKPVVPGYTPRAYVSRMASSAEAHTAAVRGDPDTGNAASGSSGNAVGLAALASTPPAVAAAVMTGTLLPALLITSGVTGVVVAYQYFTRTGLFEEPALPMQLAQANMPARSATSGQEMQDMIAYERALPQGKASVAAGDPAIEVPRTPQNTEKRVAMLKKPDGPTR